MNYITNRDHISTAALHDPNYLSHGISWGKHRYVRREGSPGNWRYIYPEDLKKAGQNLVTGAKNMVTRAGNAVSNTARNAGQAVARVTGVQQRKSLNRAQTETDKWRDRLTTKPVRPITVSPSVWRGPGYVGTFGSKKDTYAERNYNRAVENERRTLREYEKTPIGKIEGFADYVVNDLPSDVSYEVGRFLKSKVGVGYRNKINETSGRYDSAWRKLETTEHNYYSSGGAVSTEQLLAARREFDDSWSAYKKSVQDYGKTFLGSMEKLLNTPYSKSVFIRHTPQSKNKN